MSENWDDPFYDGLEQEEKEALYLHLLVTYDGPMSRMGVKAKRVIRDEWLEERRLRATPFGRKQEERQIAALRRQCERAWALAEVLIEEIGDNVVAKAVADTMAVRLHCVLTRPDEEAPGLEFLFGQFRPSLA